MILIIKLFMMMMTTNKARVYQYRIEFYEGEKRTRKKYYFEFLLEFTYQNNVEYLQKVSKYLLNNSKIHIVEQDKRDNNFYVYLRKKKYLLKKGVNVI